MKRYYVMVEVSVYADSPEQAKTEVQQCLNTGHGHIHTYLIGNAELRDREKTV